MTVTAAVRFQTFLLLVCDVNEEADWGWDADSGDVEYDENGIPLPPDLSALFPLDGLFGGEGDDDEDDDDDDDDDDEDFSDDDGEGGDDAASDAP